MSDASELLFYKLSDGRWKVVDKKGQSAVGLTKEMAENQYRTIYKLSKPVEIDFFKYFR